MSRKNLYDLRREGAAMDMAVVLASKWNPQYQAARTISNSRFNLFPSGIAFCKTVQHIQYCVNFVRDNKIAFRIRSGGHQHEGMCSGNEILIIDLSEINQIEYADKQGNPDTHHHKDFAWIPVGKKLENVYNELEEHWKTIPGGGCQSVNVGGLTQGGGWGTSIRKYGLTCDNIIKAEMVLANGALVYPSIDTLPDLFRALRGGGGGNFGVVSRFLFKISPYDDYYLVRVGSQCRCCQKSC